MKDFTARECKSTTSVGLKPCYSVKIFFITEGGAMKKRYLYFEGILTMRLNNGSIVNLSKPD